MRISHNWPNTVFFIQRTDDSINDQRILAQLMFSLFKVKKFDNHAVDWNCIITFLWTMKIYNNITSMRLPLQLNNMMGYHNLWYWFDSFNLKWY